MTPLPAVQAELNLLDAEPRGIPPGYEGAVCEEDAADIQSFGLFDEFPQAGIEERLPSGNQEPQTSHLIEFPGNGKGVLQGDIFLPRRSQVTVAAGKVASAGKLKLQVPE
jgi:hypothetical protein